MESVGVSMGIGCGGEGVPVLFHSTSMAAMSRMEQSHSRAKLRRNRTMVLGGCEARG